MTVNQESVVIWGTVIVLITVYYIFRALFFKPSVPREDKPVVKWNRRRSAPADFAPYRRHLIPLPLTYHDASPKVDDYRYPQGTTDISCAPHHRPQQFKGFRGEDLLPPGNLLGIALAVKKQERRLTAEAGKRQEKVPYTALLVACWDCDEAAIEASIQSGADVRAKTTDGETGLMLCTYRMGRGKASWNPRCLELLLENGCPINEVTTDNNTALHLAVKAGHRPATKWLLAHGATADIANNKGWRPIAIARAQRREDLVELLCEFDPESEANEDENGSSSYHTA